MIDPYSDYPLLQERRILHRWESNWHWEDAGVAMFSVGMAEQDER